MRNGDKRLIFSKCYHVEHNKLPRTIQEKSYCVLVIIWETCLVSSKFFKNRYHTVQFDLHLQYSLATH